MTVIADLHIHTRASDGLWTSEDIVQLARQKNLCAIAITDHDTVDGVEAAQTAARLEPFEVFTGIEFSTVDQQKEVHILGYCFDQQGNSIKNLLRQLNESRFTRMEKMVQKLQQLDYSITMNDVLQQAGTAAPGRPHAARVLVQKGYFPTVAAVFDALLETGKPAHVKRFKLTPQAAIAAVHDAGGFTSWAHPGLVGDDSLLNKYISYGLKGIEVYHPDHAQPLTRHYQSLARQKQLLITGGSDYHGNEAGRTRCFADFGLAEKEFTNFKYYCEQIHKIC